MKAAIGSLALVAAFVLAPTASAACWQLKNGTITETSSESTPPARGAKRISCPAYPAFPQVAASVPSSSSGPAEKLKGEVVGKYSGEAECVGYARSKQPKLKRSGLTDANAPAEHFEWKKKQITEYSPKNGRIAIIEESSYGHMAFVEDAGWADYVSKSGKVEKRYFITITEVNRKPCSSTQVCLRTVVEDSEENAEARLKVIGYFAP